MAARVIPPIVITEAMLTSSTCAEPHASETEYDPEVPYPLGYEVVVSAEHLTYSSLVADNEGNTPSTSPDHWAVVGPTLRWKCFDLYRNTKTVHASPLTYVIETGKRFNSCALFGLEGASVFLTQVVDSGEVYSREIKIKKRSVFGWFDWFYEPFGVAPSVAVFDMPLHSSSVLTITITRPTGNVSCGGIVLGKHVNLGNAQYGARSNVQNFSRITRDADGDAELIPKKSIPTAKLKILAEKSNTNRLRTVRTQLNAVPAAWFGMDDSGDKYFEALLILGIYKDFPIDVSDPQQTTVNLDLEEI